MTTVFRKESIPWLMAATRVALGPLLIFGVAHHWPGATLAAIIVSALVSDIYDGVLARRWHCDTAAVRLFDSMADTVFYACTAFALWRAQPQIFRHHPTLLASLILLELVRFVFDFSKFRKPASYHSYLAKSWGLLLAISITAAFLTPHAEFLIVAALSLGILCDLEGLTMSVLLPTWHRDVKTLAAAFRIRQQEKNHAHSRSLTLRKALTL